MLLIGLVVVELLIPGTSESICGWPLVISLLVVGMPHGAVDFEVTGHLRGAVAVSSKLHRFVGYFLAVVAGLVFLIWSPMWALCLFVLVSGLHFGLADARDLAHRHEIATPASVTLLSAVARGSLIMALPFCFATVDALKVFENILRVVGSETVRFEPASIKVFATATVLAAAAIQGAVTIRRLLINQVSLAAIELIETGVITLAFWHLHPLFAMGSYVLIWHSWRHMRTLIRFFDTDSATNSIRSLVNSIVRLHICALPLLVPTFAIFVILALWRLESWTSAGLAALAIAIFVVVTLPHHLLVEQVASRIRRDDTHRRERSRGGRSSRLPKSVGPTYSAAVTPKEHHTVIT